MAKIIQEVDRGNEKVYPITVTNAVMGEGDEGKLSEIIQGLKNRLDKLESNPNLLDNSNFKNPINQRMEESYIGQWKKGIDRWVIVGDYDVLTHTLAFNSTNSTTRFGSDAISYMRQGLDSIELGMVTMSIGIGYDTYSKTFTIDGTEQSSAWSVGPFYFIYEYFSSTKVHWFGFGVTSGAISPDWVKLEYGSKATPYIPKTYSEELLECQKYLYCITTTLAKTNLIFGSGVGLSGNKCQIFMPLPATLRNKDPNITFTANNLTFSDGNTNSVVTSIGGSGQTPRLFQNGVSIFPTSSGTITSGKFYSLRLVHPGEFIISCEP